jgi:hypothetical protein
MLICYNIGMMCTKVLGFELSKTNNFGNPNITKEVDQYIFFCYTNNML